jgi:hypothetical protein
MRPVTAPLTRHVHATLARCLGRREKHRPATRDTEQPQVSYDLGPEMLSGPLWSRSSKASPPVGSTAASKFPK